LPRQTPINHGAILKELTSVRAPCLSEPNRAPPAEKCSDVHAPLE